MDGRVKPDHDTEKNQGVDASAGTGNASFGSAALAGALVSKRQRFDSVDRS
jgi:hypothetical protein